MTPTEQNLRDRLDITTRMLRDWSRDIQADFGDPHGIVSEMEAHQRINRRVLRITDTED